MRFFDFLVILPLLAATNAVTYRPNYLKDSNSEASETAAESSDFDGFGGFGGFRGFHQFNGFMSNAFGDLDGQFDSTGFDASQSRKFDSGFGQHFLENIDHESFASELVSPHQKKKEQSTKIEQRPNVLLSTHKLPGLHQYLPTSNNGRPQETTSRKSYAVSKFTQTTQPYRQESDKHASHYKKNKPQQQVRPGGSYSRVAPNYKTYRTSPSLTKAIYPTTTYKYPTKLAHNVIPAPTNKNQAILTEKQKYDGFTFGAEKFY